MTLMPRLCIFGDALAVPGRSRCVRHEPAGHWNYSKHKDLYDYAHQQRRKARIKAGEGCAMAYLGGCHGPLCLDHIQPLSLGGLPGADNEQLLCQRHNLAKGGANRLPRGKRG